jgi:hypothetical protein
MSCNFIRVDQKSGNLQVKDVLFEPVRKTQDAMHFKEVRTEQGEMWMPCGPREPNAIQTTMVDLASEGLAAKVKDKEAQVWGRYMCVGSWCSQSAVF